MSDPLLLLSATALARAIARGELRSTAVVDAHIARIEAVNPQINAVVADRFETAREEARAADHLRDLRGPDGLPPLHGVPCTIKESFQLGGMPNTAGLVSRKGRISTEDAPTVARLRAAGAIPLAVTNTSELCMWMESNNRVYGRTRNPYDAARNVGGSSGGEGAIIGAGGSPFGLGADVGGSIRLPAFMNGVFGHKPSSGLVPNHGQFPVAHADGLRMLVSGPLCRRAEDLWPLLRVLAGPNPGEPSVDTPLRGDPALEPIAGLRVCFAERPGPWAPSPAQQDAVRRAAAALAARGAELVPARTDWFGGGFLLWSHRLSAGDPTKFHDLMAGDGPRPNLVVELLRWVFGRSAHTFPALALAVLEKLPGATAGALPPVLTRVEAIRQDIAAQLGPRGVLLLPTYPRTAPRHHASLYRFPASGYTGLFNALELPATQVPCGLDPTGLPTGVQVVANHGEDARTIAVAMALEADLGGWVPPPGLRTPRHTTRG